MPAVPEYIPLSKENRPLAVASWRDLTPSPPAPTAADGAVDTLHGAAATAAAAATTAASDDGGVDGKTAKTARTRVRGGRGAAARRQGGKEQQPSSSLSPSDVDDFFVHCALPHDVGVRDVQFEVRAAVTPLKVFDLGVCKQLFVTRRPTTTATTATAATRAGAAGAKARGAAAAANGASSDEADDGGGSSHSSSSAGDNCSSKDDDNSSSGGSGAAHATMKLSPFMTPALPPASLSRRGQHDDDEDEQQPPTHDGSDAAHDTPLYNSMTPPAATSSATTAVTAAAAAPPSSSSSTSPLPLPMMTLPPAQLDRTAVRTTTAIANSSHNNNDDDDDAHAHAHAACDPHDDVEQQQQQQQHFAMLFAERDEAERAAALLRRRWPAAPVAVVARNRGVLNCTLVLKGLPCLVKTEVILAALEQLPCRPSYVRLHRGERGVYKNVVFVKYANPTAAEDSKLRLERCHVAPGRPLKVEYKKKTPVRADEEAAAASVTATATATSGGGGGGDVASLQHIIRELRVSSEHEGVLFRRADLSTEELKLLKQLSLTYGLLIDVGDTRVKVRRCFGGNGGNGGNGGGAVSERPSPALRPQGHGGATTTAASATPAWAPATPAPLRPMDFKGIRHWKEMHNTQANNTLGIARPLGPEDHVVPFSAGRGRPM